MPARPRLEKRTSAVNAEELRKDVNRRLEKEGCYPDDLPAFGDLYQHIFENGVESEIRRYMATKAMRNAPDSPNQWMEKRLPELNVKTEPRQMTNQYT